MHRRCLVLSAAAALIAAFAPAASAHGGPSHCSGDLVEEGGTWAGTCTVPFQGFPIGVAGVYEANPRDLPESTITDADIHVEVLAKFNNGVQRALGVECVETNETGVARCELESNMGAAPFTSPEPLPTDIVSLTCNTHGHAPYSRFYPPAGEFACWSTSEARASLAAEGWFAKNGFGGAPEPQPQPEPEPSPLDPLSGAGVSSTVTTVPFNTYAPDTLVVSRSLGLRYVNVDTARHDVVALDARRPAGSAPWCANYEAGKCPLFWSPLIPGGGSETPVLGLEDAKPGETYSFFCTLHNYMVGTLRVVD